VHGVEAGAARDGVQGGVVDAQAANADPQIGARAAQGQSWFDIKLLIKLGFLLAVLGQSSTTSHIAIMVGMAVVVYCAQVGILRYLLDSVRAVGQPQAQPNANAGNANVGLGGINQVPQLGDVAQLGNIPHATTGGVCTDLQIFVMGLFMSLVPSWAPVGMNAPLIPIEAPVPAADEPGALPPAVGALPPAAAALGAE
jgi:hypothetical protein